MRVLGVMNRKHLNRNHIDRYHEMFQILGSRASPPPPQKKKKNIYHTHQFYLLKKIVQIIPYYKPHRYPTTDLVQE